MHKPPGSFVALIKLLPVAAVLLNMAIPASALGAPGFKLYAGSKKCAECHPRLHAHWGQTLHATAVRAIGDIQPEDILGDFSEDEPGLRLDEVKYVIGGHWYQRYMVEVDGRLYVAPQVWSVATHRWELQDQWSWDKKPYDTFCIGCHATRYDPESTEMVEANVGCEACHGPGGAHAGSGGEEHILNPGKLDPDERDMICASCHVRGEAPGTDYKFAVGFVPGDDLTRHYAPTKVMDGESAQDAFLRLFREWMVRFKTGAVPPQCDVCGISARPTQHAEATVDGECLSCHKFGDDYEQHTRHPGQLDLQCLDCHRAMPSAVAKGDDVHDPLYFRVHETTAFSSPDVSACIGCHRDFSATRTMTILTEWSHSDHSPGATPPGG